VSITAFAENLFSSSVPRSVKQMVTCREKGSSLLTHPILFYILNLIRKYKNVNIKYKK